MSITTDVLVPYATHLKRAAATSARLQATVAALQADESDAIHRVATKASGDKKHQSGVAAPDDTTEPPTSNTDSVGDAAISHRLTQNHNTVKTLVKAIAALNKTMDHLELTIAAGWRLQTDEVDTDQLCGRGCNRHKEPGRPRCLECGDALARIEREQEHPTCGICGINSVERYSTVAGVAYRGMYYDGDNWQPSSSNPPTCSTCRRTNKAAA